MKNLWTDESKLKIFGSKRINYIRPNAEEKMMPDFVVPSVKYGGGAVIFFLFCCGMFLELSDFGLRKHVSKRKAYE